MANPFFARSLSAMPGLAALTHRPVLIALLLGLVVRLCWFGVAQLGVQFHKPASDRQFVAVAADGLGYTHTSVQCVDMWTRFDGVRYLALAQQGYPRQPPF